MSILPQKEVYRGTSKIWVVDTYYKLESKVGYWFTDPIPAGGSNASNSPASQGAATYWRLQPQGFGVSYWNDPDREPNDRASGSGVRGLGFQSSSGKQWGGQTQYYRYY
ncbi:hypothetical protein B0H11DRAFT_1925599 [Mycena galericulata]|nr:hypothetical protein B0H11DRAFT_1925599 [Mycena galericulata]